MTIMPKLTPGSRNVLVFLRELYKLLPGNFLLSVCLLPSLKQSRQNAFGLVSFHLLQVNGSMAAFEVVHANSSFRNWYQPPRSSLSGLVRSRDSMTSLISSAESCSTTVSPSIVYFIARLS